MKRTCILAALIVATLTTSASAKNVDLVTLPGRDTVQLTIYNSEDITLARETRYITFKKGLNKLQFSWANTLIDPTSIELRPLEQADKIEVVATVFPGQKPQHLIWNVQSDFEGQAKMEVSYFTSGLTWRMDYVATCNPGEDEMLFKGFVRVFNKSGEDYEDAEVRLIVGKINLVEKIADLARRHGRPMPRPETKEYDKLKKDVAKESFARARRAMKRPATATAPKGIVKEGISEYFMFTVQGRETVPNGWSKRMRAIKAEGVKFDIVHRVRSHQYGISQPVRFFIFTNDKEHKLGECPLPDGQVRVFRDNGRDGLTFLAEQLVRYVPIKAKAEIKLGHDKLVVYERRKVSTRRSNFRFHDPPGPPIEYVVGWDEEQKWTDEIRNYRSKPITLELRRVYKGDVDFSSEIATGVFNFETIEAKFRVAAGGRDHYPHTVVIHHGANAKHTRVRIIR